MLLWRHLAAQRENILMITLDSFKFAGRGLRLVLSRERNARIHVAFAALAVILSVVFRISIDQFAVIVLSITLVLFAEIVNTAIERTLDLTYQENSQLVRYIKDTTAAGVLVTAVGSVVVAVVIFGPHLWRLVGLRW